MIDIIVPVYNNIEYTKLFLLSLKGQTYKDFQVLIINNGSTDGTRDYLQNFNGGFNVNIINNIENLGYVKAINQGLEQSKSQYVLLGNNDTIFPKNLLEKLVKNIGNFGIIAPYTNNISKSSDSQLLIKYEGTPSIEDIDIFAKNLDLKFGNLIQYVDAVFGHCMFINRKVIEDIGFLDEEFGIGNYDDIDFCMRAKNKGYSIGLLKGAFIYHFCHTTFKYLGMDINKILEKNFKLFQRKWS